VLTTPLPKNLRCNKTFTKLWIWTDIFGMIQEVAKISDLTHGMCAVCIDQELVIQLEERS
jgi:hypothetical protein